MTESVLDVQESLFECRVGPLCLGIVINHLTECDVIDIIPAPNLHIKVSVEDAKLKCIHDTNHFHLTGNSVEMEGERIFYYIIHLQQWANCKYRLVESQLASFHIIQYTTMHFFPSSSPFTLSRCGHSISFTNK